MPDPISCFERERQHLRRLAYRMLGSLSEADDVVQDAWLRWEPVASGIGDPRAWLTRVVTRICIDRARSARARREVYVGEWLPEPWVGAEEVDGALERAEEISLALLLALERLSPLERAAFLLHDVFDADYATISRVLERKEPACRQLVVRARARIRDARPRFPVDAAAARRVDKAFATALTTGKVDDLAELLAEDAVFISDGGGKRTAALNPIRGRGRIVAFLSGLARKGRFPRDGEVRHVSINGAPGLLIISGADVQTVSWDLSEGGAVSAIYVVSNPDKVGRWSIGESLPGSATSCRSSSDRAGRVR